MAIKFLNTVAVDTDVLYVDASSNKVGIGTTSPSGPLHVKGSTNEVVVYIDTNNNAIGDAASIQFNDRAKVGWFESAVYLGDNGQNKDIKLKVNTGDIISLTSNTERMRITSAGNVGIGTTSPSHKLTIPSGTNGRVARLGNLEITTQAATYSGSSIEVTGSNSFIKYNSTLGHKFFTRVQGGGNTLEALTIVPDTGNVGIGTTSPTEKLDVGGNVKLRGTNNLTIGSTSNGGNFSLSSGIRGFNFANNNGDLVRIDANGNVGIGTTGPTQALHVAGNARVTGAYYDSNNSAGTSGQVLSSTGSATSWVSGSGLPGGPYLPLAGGTMTGTTRHGDDVVSYWGAGDDLEIYHNSSGDSVIQNHVGDLYFTNKADDKDIIFRSDNGSGGVENYIQIDGSAGRTLFNKNIRVNDNVQVQVGNSADFLLSHNGTNSYVSNYTGDLYIENAHDDGDIVFKSDNGSGGTTEYFRLDGGLVGTFFSERVMLPDNTQLQLGTSGDLQIYHDGSHSYVKDTGTGNLTLSGTNLYLTTNNGQILFKGITDAETGLYYDNSLKLETTSTGVTVTGGWVTSGVSVAQANVEHTDNTKALFGNGNDLEIYHDGSNSYIQDTGTGNLIITASSSLQLKSAGDEFYMIGNADGQVALYNNGIKKFETASTGVEVIGTATATTFSGDLNGTINTATTAVTKPNATNDTTVATTAFVQNLIGTIPAGLVFQGTWNASTNTPTLSSGSGTTGHFYIVSTDGSTNLDGITDWKVGDWAVFVEQGATDAWEKVDNSSVLDGSGTGQKVTMWSGSGTSNTLTNAPITVSGNNSTFAGTVLIDGVSNYTGLEVKGVGGSRPEIKWSNANNGNLGNIYGTETNSLVIATGSSGTTALTLDSSQNATFAGDVAIQQTGDVYLTLESTDASTAEEAAIKYSNQSTGSNYWWAGLNQSANYSLAYGTAYSGANVKMEISTAGDATFAGDLYLKTTNDASIAREKIIWQTSQGTNRSFIRVGGSYASNDLEFGTGDSILGMILHANAGLSIGTTVATALPPASGLLVQGNVGIGTTSPAEKLEVSGSIKSGNLKIEPSNGGRIGLNRNTSTGAIYNNSYGAFQLQNNGTGFLELQSYNSSGGYTGVLSMLESNGNVGIGTTSPDYKLEVSGTLGVSRTDGIIFAGSGGTGTGSKIASNTSNDLIFSTALPSAPYTTTERVRVLNNGNVGIGTTSPGRKLHVAGTARVDSTFYLGTDDSCAFFRYYNSLLITNTASTNVQVGGGPGSVNNNFFIGNGYLDVNGTIRGKNYLYLEDAGGTLRTSLRVESTYATLDNGSNSFNYNASNHLFLVGLSEKMRINSSGNVGIGISAISEKLEVNGSIKATATTDAYKGYIKQTVISHASEKSENANYNFFPYNTTALSQSPQYYNRMTAAYDGRIKKIYLRHGGGSTPTATAVNFKKHTNGVTSSTVYSATVANTASTNMTAYYEFGNNDFTFNAGDLIGLLYQTTDAFGTASKTMGGVTATIIIEYNIT